MAISHKAQGATVCVLTAIFLFVSYLGIGFWACSELPLTTQLLASSSINSDDSPYSDEDLVALAVETRNFTVENYGRTANDSTPAADMLAEHIIDAAHSSSAANSPKSEYWSQEALAILDDSNNISPSDAMQKLAEVGVEYSLDNNAIEHLNDVNSVVSVAFTPILGCVIIAAFLLFVGDRMFGSKIPGAAMEWAGGLTLGVFLIIGVWAGLNFNGFFSAIHSLFFAEGSWLFPADSLLINMYPTSFWIGMGIVWACVSVILAAISLITGFFMNRKTPIK